MRYLPVIIFILLLTVGIAFLTHTCSNAADAVVDDIKKNHEREQTVSQQCHDCCTIEEFGLAAAEACFKKCRSYVRTFSETDDTEFVPRYCAKLQEEFRAGGPKCP